MTLEKIILKYSLPSKQDLENEIGIIKFDKEEDGEESIIKEIISKLRDKIEKYISFLEDIIQPDSSMISLQESNVFSENEREEIFNLLKNIIFLQRKYLLINIDGNLNDKANYFNELFSNWKQIKNSLKPIIKKSLSVWKENSDDEVKQNYFG